jgi:hypothetical protein
VKIDMKMFPFDEMVKFWDNTNVVTLQIRSLY